ncbi:FAD-dependent monooxygenase [Ottowia thiooxydans]|uniref:FAD-dependent monooxygenase n=1 Tax=Ottowia thiooxydans TaxID=219182 RepID=UPI0003FA32D4|nr:FAD-dependent monooxygenase [Ottowia thiooxydans]
MAPKQLLIAGGGIGGLAAALAATRAGWEVRVFERTPQFSEVGAGIQLGPNATRILQSWGLGDALSAVAAFPERLQVRNALSGELLGGMPLGERMRTRYGASYATIHRADIHGLLATAVQQQAEVHLNLDQGLREFADDGCSVTITTEQGLQVEGDALIGADGVWSGTRQQLLGDSPPRVTGHLAYRTMLRQTSLPERLRSVQVTAWLGPRLHVVQYPVRGGEWMNVVAIVQGVPRADAPGWDQEAHVSDLQRAMGATCEPLQSLIAAVPAASVNEHAWRLWPLSDRAPVSGPGQMAGGLVGLLGDAAHPMRPYMAQGAGMAIEDAAALERALAMNAVDVPTRLRRYALERWQRCARVQARSIRNGQIFHSTGLIRLGRDVSMRLLGERLLDVPWLYKSS